MNRWRLLTRLGEISAGAMVAALIVIYSRFVNIDPLDRISQVSAMAALQIPVVVISVIIALALLQGYRMKASPFGQLLQTISWSAISGIPSGILAGGIRLALQGANYQLNGMGGDGFRLVEWTNHLIERNFDAFPRMYPPLMPSFVALVAEITGMPTAQSWKISSLLVTALLGPVAYLSARLILKRGWALISPIALASLYDPYKPYTAIALIVMIPLVVRLIQMFARPSKHSALRGALLAAALGGLVGVIALLYSGWFIWTVPGVLCASIYALIKSPQKLRTLLNAAASIAGLLTIAGYYILGIIFGPAVKDDFTYFDTYVEPAYFLIWLGDKNGAHSIDLWPPLGELGGVGAFMLLLIAGVVVAVSLGWHSTTVKYLTFTIIGAWFLRMYLASQMGETGLVQLYPRTSALLHVFMIFLTGIAVKESIERIKWAPETAKRASVAGACGVIFLFSLIGSSTLSNYMPKQGTSLGNFAWNSHHVPGDCSNAVPANECPPLP